MDSNILTIFKKIFIGISANIYAAAASFVVALVLPRVLGVEEYGYFQLFMFYLSFLGVLHFGFLEGIILRYGGFDYEKLDKPLMHSQYTLLLLSQIFFAICICLGAILLINDASLLIVAIGVGIICLIHCPHIMLHSVLQITGRVKDSAVNTIIEHTFFAAIALSMALIFGVNRFPYIILAFVIARFIAVLSMAFICKDIVFSRGVKLKDSLSEAWTNLSAGSKMLGAGLSGLLVIGVVRFAIERVWDVAIFGQVALALNVANLLMIFVNAVGVVMFPVIKRMESENRGSNYKILRFLLVTVLLGMLTLYFPARPLLAIWLPQFTVGIGYLLLIFPICLFEGKIGTLIINYYRTLRLEKTLLYVNLISLATSIILTVIVIYVLENLTLAILSILLLSAFRCILSEIMIARQLGVNINADVMFEFSLVVVFLLTGWFLPMIPALLVYVALYLIYLFIHRKSIHQIKHLVFSNS